MTARPLAKLLSFCLLAHGRQLYPRNWRFNARNNGLRWAWSAFEAEQSIPTEAAKFDMAPSARKTRKRDRNILPGSHWSYDPDQDVTLVKSQPSANLIIAFTQVVNMLKTKRQWNLDRDRATPVSRSSPRAISKVGTRPQARRAVADGISRPL
ncbi:MAG: hypothetical protein Q9178_007929 [Gyalolechia marmorata]